MKVLITRFKANDPNLTFNDVVQNIRVGVTEKGKVLNVHFNTTDKYIEVDATGTYHGPEHNGQVILLHPFLHVMGEDGVLQHLDGCDDEFYEHPDYWSAEVLISPEYSQHFTRVVIPLKHEYFVSFVPEDEAMNYNCLRDVDITTNKQTG